MHLLQVVQLLVMQRFELIWTDWVEYTKIIIILLLLIMIIICSSSSITIIIIIIVVSGGVVMNHNLWRGRWTKADWHLGAPKLVCWSGTSPQGQKYPHPRGSFQGGASKMLLVVAHLQSVHAGRSAADPGQRDTERHHDVHQERDRAHLPALLRDGQQHHWGIQVWRVFWHPWDKAPQGYPWSWQRYLHQ